MAQCVPPFGFFWISGSYGPISNDKSILLVNVVDTLRLVGGAPKEFLTAAEFFGHFPLVNGPLRTSWGCRTAHGRSVCAPSTPQLDGAAGR